MTKDELIHEYAAAYERLIAAATAAAQRGSTGRDGWGPREVVAHLTGWEVMASTRIPAVAGGMPPAEFHDPTQETVMNNAINAAFTTLMGEQSLEALCGILRQAYQRNVEMLKGLGDQHFQPGEYVYEWTLGVIEHCQEHTDKHLG